MKAEFVTFICTIFIGQKPVIRVRMIAPWDPGLKATFHTEMLNSQVPCASRMCAPGDPERQTSKRSQEDSHVAVLCLHVSGLHTSDWHLSVTLRVFLSKGSWGRAGQADRETASRLIIQWSRDWSCTDHFYIMHWSHDCPCTDHDSMSPRAGKNLALLLPSFSNLLCPLLTLYPLS